MKSTVIVVDASGGVVLKDGVTVVDVDVSDVRVMMPAGADSMVEAGTVDISDVGVLKVVGAVVGDGVVLTAVVVVVVSDVGVLKDVVVVSVEELKKVAVVGLIMNNEVNIVLFSGQIVGK